MTGSQTTECQRYDAKSHNNMARAAWLRHGGCAHSGRRGDLGLRQVGKILQDQDLALADGQSLQRRHDGGARQGDTG